MITINYKVSVIVPVYNVKEYLNCAIDSLINQTIGFENIQVIIVDDCSDDGSKEIIMEYEKKYDNILAIYRENNSGSAGIPRNDALEYVKADYIMFLDPDDYYSKDYCETLYEKITTNDVDLVKCNNTDLVDGKRVLNQFFNKNVDEIMLDSKNNPLTRVSVCSGIHKTEIIKENNIGFPDCIGEDAVFSINELIHVRNMLYLNNYFGYVYRNSNDSHAKQPSIKKICSIFEGFDMAIDITRSHNREDVANTILGHQISGVYYRLMENEDSLKQKKVVLNRTYTLLKKLPNLKPSNLINKIAITLTKHKLFYLTLIYLKILKFCKHSNTLNNLYKKLVLKQTITSQ